jgi:hypothetical protein
VTPAGARAVIALAAAFGGGGGSGVEQPGFSRRRARPEPLPAPTPYAPPPGAAPALFRARKSAPQPLSPAAAERVRLADEKRARKAAKLEATAAKGAIRRAGT